MLVHKKKYSNFIIYYEQIDFKKNRNSLYFFQLLGKIFYDENCFSFKNLGR
ncbi:hypothetical protein LEP1GSC064_2677 [Leptospira kirschneri serovar Grippotyphosa str. Moskva]|nr:hypothetical protein LEP1GSC044_3366 [Leptospira kirschneri serovar Grippotyphosa str. RM52]EKQ85726.1 hypothetical protein LEP1GSC064_2677 [Leptospira kirschneri serovar Grippotyphosa str. Moskva]EKR08940.1 hypothetical protein LEP1GSC122_0795 [Leptospira kirschneri serovar Valbuzzi str. 200702274]EMK04337.1 hypothetical protein LEP1GSC176_1010 [Leptospira kirschneri str. MMD1493]